MGNPSDGAVRDQDEFEIGDVESYGNNKDTGFSHQSLVMTCMRRALENGSKEMKPGWFQNKIDKMGNQIRTYIEDTRESFISSVEACLMVMECDIDDKHREIINRLLSELETKKKELISLEEAEWNSLNRIIQKNLNSVGKGYIHGHFNKDKRFYQAFLEEKVRVYRELFKVLTRQTKDLDFYAAEIFVA